MTLAEKRDVVRQPHDWDKAVSAGYLRLMGLSQQRAAKGAGIGERTLARYELSDWWPEACGEAVSRWMQQLEIECRTTIMAAVKAGDVPTAVKMLERIDKRLAPPRLSHRIEHDGALATSLRGMTDEELRAHARRLVTRVAAYVDGAENGDD